MELLGWILIGILVCGLLFVIGVVGLGILLAVLGAVAEDIEREDRNRKKK